MNLKEVFQKSDKDNRSRYIGKAKDRFIEFERACQLIVEASQLIGHPKPEKLPHIVVYENNNVLFQGLELWYDAKKNEFVYLSIEGGE